jgi:hypothetical protein
MILLIAPNKQKGRGIYMPHPSLKYTVYGD